MTRKISVFISSAMRELECEREVAKETLLAMNAAPVLFELFPSMSEAPAQAYTDGVQDCDIFVLILWTSLRPAVMAEYHEALRRGKPILVLVKTLAENEERDQALQQFLNQLTGTDATGLAVRLTYRVFRGVADLREALRAAVSTEIAKLYREPVATQSREEMYELGTSIARHSQRRIYLYQSTPSLILGARGYLAAGAEKLACEEGFAKALREWVERNYRNHDKEFVCLFSVDATRRELAELALHNAPHYPQYLDTVREHVQRYKAIEAQSGHRFRLTPVRVPVSGPLMVGDNRFAIWLSGGPDAIAMSQVSEKIADMLVRMLRARTMEPMTERQLLDALAL